MGRLACVAWGCGMSGIRTAAAAAAAIEAMASRLVDRWHATTPQRRFEGLMWYPQASAVAARLMPHDPERAAAVLAALSPRLGWEDNVRDAETVLGGAERPLRALPANQAVAWAALQADDPGAALSGPKVRAFFAALTGDESAVPVDTWAARAALPADDSRPLNRIGRAERARIESAYRIAADFLNVAPRTLQATMWLDAREG